MAPPSPLPSPPSPLMPAPPPPSPLVPAPPFIPEGAAVTPPREPGFFAEPPPTHIQRPEAHVDRPFTPPQLFPVPEIPEPGLVNAARYAVRFGRARWQRRGAIRTLGAEIKPGHRVARSGARRRSAASPAGSASTAACSPPRTPRSTPPRSRIAALGKEQAEVEGRRADENSKFVDIEAERNAKLVEAERMAAEVQQELLHLEGQRRALRDKPQGARAPPARAPEGRRGQRARRRRGAGGRRRR